MSWPHALSVSRVLAAPIIAVLTLSTPNGLLWAAGLFALASLTDTADGSLARRSGAVGSLGIYLDTTADKACVSVVLVGLALAHLVDGWVVMVIIAREFLVSGVRTLAAVQGIIISARFGGKLKTAVTMVAIVVVLLGGNVSRGGALASLGHAALLNGVSWWAMAASAALTVVSGASYLLDARPVFATGVRETKDVPRPASGEAVPSGSGRDAGR